jgi:hypothetical protein
MNLSFNLCLAFPKMVFILAKTSLKLLKKVSLLIFTTLGNMTQSRTNPMLYRVAQGGQGKYIKLAFTGCFGRFLSIFMQLGFNSANDKKSSSILIYFQTCKSIYTQSKGIIKN